MNRRHAGRLMLLAMLGCSVQAMESCAPGGEEADPPVESGAAGAGEPAALKSNVDPNHPLEVASERAAREFAGNFGEPLPEFAAKCDIATGIHVPDFNCSAGTQVPDTHSTGTYPNMTCDRPNRLNQQCDPGSRFQIVAQSPDAVAVAHCRKQGLSGNNYGDIAVIQYNKANGAVCFYQALGTMDGNFQAPSKGTSRSDQADSPNPNAAPWLSNFQTHSIDCGGCHDNGGIIRSPYLAQLSICPGAGDFSYNSTAPLRFIGNDYQDWNTWSVKITGNVCNNCHRLAVAGHGSRPGTSQDYGLRATAVSPPAVGSERQKNPHSADSPIWMTPGQITYSAGNDAASHAIADCATKWRAGQALPAGCTVSALSSKWTGITPASAIRVLTEVYIN